MLNIGPPATLPDLAFVAEPAEAVPVYRARLPTTDDITPYLRLIDASRHYANRGPLVCALEQRLQQMIAPPGCSVLTAASGTAALQGAILAQAGRATAGKPYALIPAYTFVATAMAAEACGYQPVFVDIDPGRWTAGSAAFRDHPALPQAGIALPVAPFGMPPNQIEWAAFTADTGVAVVIDAAASFEALATNQADVVGAVPVVLSFHATKSFSTGEGGAVIWSDIEGLMRTAQALNFGFLWRRESRAAGFNGKMSEYHAAIGLAGLDSWAATTARYQRINAYYRTAALKSGLADRIFTGPSIASNYALFLARSDTEAAAITTSLKAAGIEHRFWYGTGVHREPYFCRADRPSLPNTETLADRLIGIPIYPDIPHAAIDRIVARLAAP